MKTKLFLAALILGTSTIANAQVLGGNVVGGIGGSLGGGLGGARDIGVVGKGTANGAFGTDLDTQPLRHSTREMTNRTAQRTRAGVDKARERTRSTVSSANTAVDAGRRATKTPSDAAADTSLSGDASASKEGVHARGAVNGAANVAAGK